jgi:signal peptidase II
VNQLVLLLVLIIGFLDQATKYIANHLRPIWLNSNDSFSLGFSNASLIQYSIVLLLFIILIISYVKNLTVVFGLSLILGGGLSNLFDRIFFGGVRDVVITSNFFLNLADIFVLIGVSAIIFFSLCNVLKSH